MAQIINKSNHLRKELFTEVIKLIIFVISALLCLVIVFETYGLSLIGTIIFSVYIRKTKIQFNIIRSGLKGEKEVLSLLGELPKRYKVITDLLIKDKNKSSQIDFIVIGSNGIFIVESKNIRGTLTGNESDKYVLHTKIIRGGKSYKRQLYNPIFQVKGHSIGLSKLLKKNKLVYPIQGIVYLSNNESVSNIQSKEIPILSKSKDDLLKYIRAYKNKDVKLSPKDQKSVVQLLKKHIL